MENAERRKHQEREIYRRDRNRIRARRLELAPKHRAKNNERERVRYAALRAEVITAYGSACCCCGETEPLFLEIDHTRGDGARHRREIGRGAKAMCAWLRRNGFPQDGFQLLCSNCNQGKKRGGGVCPHRS